MAAIQKALDRILKGSHLSAEQAEECIGEIMAGVVGEALLAAFSRALPRRAWPSACSISAFTWRAFDV